ncbi:hypothetical protein TCA2_4493 [Paenibacillus sp. TCA20]|uniref:hypothetical protein n=1 Tax=Paenibacillus sp. TCA20 TaxID=1499968 RepID=UPI0004DA2D56|nr:hypothetical protein [Paenibacillus sp. TCA20]GAK42001.1 hypothetical protein TCA2_4493 [Paenibacillus sp. TCA20]
MELIAPYLRTMLEYAIGDEYVFVTYSNDYYLGMIAAATEDGITLTFALVSFDGRDNMLHEVNSCSIPLSNIKECWEWN